MEKRLIKTLAFSRCFFSENKAPLGVAVELLIGKQEFLSCEFKGNSVGEKGIIISVENLL